MQTGGVDAEGAGEFFLKKTVELKANENKEALFKCLTLKMPFENSCLTTLIPKAFKDKI